MLKSKNFDDSKSFSFTLISFGSDEYYVTMAVDLLVKINKRYSNSRFVIYEKNDLPDEILNYALENPRGFGYWKWKPYIIQEFISRETSSDIVFYIDGRSDFTSKKIDWLDSFLQDSSIDLAVYCMKFMEYNWTKNLLFEYLNANHPIYYYSSQIAGGIQLFRINKRTKELYKKWYEISQIDEMIDDSLKLEDKLIMRDLVEHRHDQSIYSLLVKLEYFNENSHKLAVINNVEINSLNSVTLQSKSHRYSPYKDRIKKIIRFIFPNIIIEFVIFLKQKNRRK